MRILFKETFAGSGLFFEKPFLAVKKIPEWYKLLPLTTDGKPQAISANGWESNTSLKGCPPFLDSLTAGYMFTTPCDIQIKKEKDGEIFFTWLADIDSLVSGHFLDQAPPELAPTSSTVPMKWAPGWQVETPRGYSTLFTHPLNRNDLPFYTLSGVVETDKYKLPTEFPFIIQDRFFEVGESFILKRGTPFVQAIPFKRDPWSSSFQKFNADKFRKEKFLLRSKIFKSYKTLFWEKKLYS